MGTDIKNISCSVRANSGNRASVILSKSELPNNKFTKNKNELAYDEYEFGTTCDPKSTVKLPANATTKISRIMPKFTVLVKIFTTIRTSEPLASPPCKKNNELIPINI